jgi:hypothetical protein
MTFFYDILKWNGVVQRDILDIETQKVGNIPTGNENSELYFMYILVPKCFKAEKNLT